MLSSYVAAGQVQELAISLFPLQSMHEELSEQVLHLNRQFLQFKLKLSSKNPFTQLQVGAFILSPTKIFVTYCLFSNLFTFASNADS